MKNAKSRHWYYRTHRVAMRELGMAEDQYRDLLAEFGAKLKDGKHSASTMTIPQLEQVLEYLKKECGFKLRRSASNANFKDGQLAKCQRLWSLLHEAGVMHQPYSDAVLAKWAYRLTKVNQIQWADTNGLSKVIEALKSVAKRERVEID